MMALQYGTMQMVQPEIQAVILLLFDIFVNLLCYS